jgi:Family of unknown function (DUF5767)
MSVTIQAMEDIATSLPDVGFSTSNGGDYGNVIEVSELGDDMGMSLLTNSRYTSSSSMPSISLNTGGNERQGTQMNVDSFGGGLQNVEVSRFDSLEPISLDFSSPAQEPTIQIQREASSYQAANSFGNDGSWANQQSSSGPSIQLAPAVSRDPIKEAAEKADYINKLQRLEAKGFPVAKRFTMDNNLDEIKAEYMRLVDARQLETSIRFQRNMLMGFVTGTEWLNNKFDPFDLKLDGWSEGLHENIEDYDEIFEELYDKYKERGKMPPEARLMFQLAGSGFMCHVTNSFFRSKMPSADDIFKNNPDLAKQFAAAAASQASPGFGNFMGMAMGVQPQAQQQQQQQQQQQPQQPMGVPFNMASGPGAFFNSPQMPQHIAAQHSQTPVARPQMSGPSGVDDILKTFEEIRLAEEQQMPNFPVMPPRNVSNPAMAAASELQSIASEDVGSVGTQQTSGGRRKKRQAPTGNVVTLNA